MKKFLLIAGILALLVATSFPFLLKHRLAQEGYNSWEAVKNYLFHDGEIRVQLPQNFKITDASCNRGTNPSIKDNIVVFKIGYTWDTSIDVKFRDSKGDSQTLSILTDKLNNWNRMNYTLSDSGKVVMIENGILQTHGFTVTNNTTEQGAAANP